MNRIKYFAQAEQVIEAWWATFVECANPAHGYMGVYKTSRRRRPRAKKL